MKLQDLVVDRNRLGDIESLKRSIQAEGVREAIVADGETFTVLSGNRRAAAVQALISEGHPVSCPVIVITGLSDHIRHAIQANQLQLGVETVEA